MKHSNPFICRSPVLPFRVLACVLEALPRRVKVTERRRRAATQSCSRAGSQVPGLRETRVCSVALSSWVMNLLSSSFVSCGGSGDGSSI